MRLAWIDKRELVPGGCNGLHKEVSLSDAQVNLAASPHVSTRNLVEKRRRTYRPTP